MQSMMRSNRTDLGEALIDALRVSGARVFVEYMNELMNAYSRNSDLPALMRTFTSMAELRVEPDVASYTMLVTALVRAGRRDEADRLYADMRAKRVNPDGLFFSRIIIALSEQRDVLRALRYLDEARASYTAISRQAYTALTIRFAPLLSPPPLSLNSPQGSWQSATWSGFWTWCSPWSASTACPRRVPLRSSRRCFGCSDTTSSRHSGDASGRWAWSAPLPCTT